MTKLAVVLQIVGAVALIVGAGFAINWWAAIGVCGVVAMMVGEAVERR